MTKEDVKLIAANGRISIEKALIGEGHPALGDSTSSLLEEAIEGILTSEFGTECPTCYEKAMDVEDRWYPFTDPDENKVFRSCSECWEDRYNKELIV